MLETTAVSCKEVRGQLAAFLEDMLAEDEYQALHAHLTYCAECAKQAEAVDSLSNQIRALCRVKVPEDLADTIVFQIKKQPKRFTFELSGWEKMILMIVLNVLIGSSSFLFGLFYFKSPLRSQQSLAPPIVSAQLIAQRSGPPSDAESEVLLQALKSILVGLGGEEEGEIHTPAQAVKPFHWHLHLDPRNRTAIIEMKKIWGIKTDFESDEELVLAIPKAHFGEFAERVKIMTGGLANLEEDKLKKALSGETIQVSIYFTIVPA